ncbi:MAG: hypothetical protein ACOCP8_04900 [archaeon]
MKYTVFKNNDNKFELTQCDHFELTINSIRLANSCGYGSKTFINIMSEQFNAQFNPYKKIIEFNNSRDAFDAIDWIEGMHVAKKLSEIDGTFTIDFEVTKNKKII